MTSNALLVSRHHCLVPEKFKIRQIVESLKKSKFKLIPLLEVTEESIKKVLNQFSIILARNIIQDKNHEILYTQEFNLLMDLKLNEDFPNYILEMKIFSNSQESLNSIQSIVKQKFSKRLIDGTYQQKNEIERLNNLLKIVSPNGKLLYDEELLPLYQLINDDKLRLRLKKISSTFGVAPIHIGYLKSRLKLSKEEIIKLTSDNNLIAKKFHIECQSCQFPSEFMFETKEKIEGMLKNSSYSCPICKNKKYKIDEVFCLNEKIEKVISLGLWLEKFVDRLIKERSTANWPNRVFEGNEIDNVFLSNNDTVIVECKDTSFGIYDLHTLMIKAEDLNAKYIIIVTTNKIHENVKKQIEKFNEKRERQIITIENNNSNVIKTQFNNFIQNQFNKELNDLFIKEDYRYRRFGRLRLKRRM
jgi:hypothetical protein